MWIRRLCLAAVLLLVCAPAWGATSIELQQSDGTKSAWGGVGDAAKVVIGSSSTVTPLADVSVTGTATLISAASTTRRALSCTNQHASVHVRWGSGAVTAAIGQRVPAGSSIEITSLAAIYMISEGADVTVSCTEE